MILVASANGAIGLPAAMAALRAGGSAIEAVETAVRLVESNPEDHTVGLGGLPNLLGEVELDASIMDGRTRAAGAVGALRGHEHPITLARQVMEELPHVLIAGEGANRFAAELGHPRVELLTPEARARWRRWLDAEEREHDPGLERYAIAMRHRAGRAADPEHPTETVNVLALDRDGHLAGAVSTSGWEGKYPGRLGDSPVIGAGLYVDDRYGAAACTGRGELAIRAGTARSLVLRLELGADLEAAARAALADVQSLADPYHGPFSLIALAPDGRHCGLSNRPDREYALMSDEMDAPVLLPRQVAP